MNNDVYELVKNDFCPPLMHSDDKSVVDFRAMNLGRIPKGVFGTLQSFSNEWRDKNLDAWLPSGEFSDTDGWWNMAENLGKHLEVLLHAPKGSCILLPSVTDAVQQIISSPEVNIPGKRVVVATDKEYPTIYDILHNHNRRFENYSTETKDELRLKIVIEKFGDDLFDPQRIIDRINDRVALVILSHVVSFTGELLRNEDIRAVVAKAEKHGTKVILDGSQAIGSVDIAVQDLGVHIYVGTLLKHGCGGPGNGYVYLRPDVDLHPTNGGWVGVAEPFTYDGSVTGRPPHPNALRRMFGKGTPAIAPMYHAVEGLRVFEKVGYPRVVRDFREKTSVMVTCLRNAGLPVISPTDPERASALIALKIPDGESFKRKLSTRRGVEVSAYGDLVRLSPHIYLSAKEIKRGIYAIIEIYHSQAGGE